MHGADGAAPKASFHIGVEPSTSPSTKPGVVCFLSGIETEVLEQRYPRAAGRPVSHGATSKRGSTVPWGRPR